MGYDIVVGRNEADKKAFGNKGLIYIGKSYVKMGQYTSLSNKISMDVARSHVVLVAGKRGSGKCLHEDTLITLADGSQIPVKNLEENKENVLSLNEKLKIESSEKTEFFSRKVNKLLRIKLRSGKEIKLTLEHPLLTIKGWEEAQKLTIGSRIATPRKTCFGDKEMPDHEIQLLSYLVAEGHTKKVVLFSNSDEKIVNEFQEALKKFDSTLQLIKEKENHYRISSPNWKNKIIESNIARDKKGQFTKETKNNYKKRSIRKLIEREELFGLLSTEKYLSDNIIQLKKEKLALFLNRLFSCDGSIYKVNEYWEGSYSSSSEKMIRQIQSLLLRFEILSKLREKNIKNNGKEFKSYELVINSENLLKFIEKIGFFGKKEERQKKAYEEIKLKIRNPNVDTIPQEVWQLYKPKNWTEIGRELGYKYPKAMRERIHYSPSRQTLLQISEISHNNPLHLLATSDIFWDEIISMNLLEGEFTVYDICVPKNHNFIANDIIVHNSYTLGVIAEELSNLQKEAKENIASLIFDTMGIYWTMKYKNEKDRDLLSEWELKPQNLPVKIFVPFGYYSDYIERGIPADEKFALDVTEMASEDWILTFGLSITNPISVLIQRIIPNLRTKNSFNIKDIISEIERDEKTQDEIKNASISLFEAAESWGTFAESAKEATKVSDLIIPGATSILDLSVYNSVGAFNVRALVISLVSRKIFNQRMASRKEEEVKSVAKGLDYSFSLERKENPIVWLFIDEAHEFLPLHEKTLATDSLVQILREGRQPGISLVLATQQPGQIHRDVMTQSDIVISHRVTSAPDLEALNYIMQSYLLDSIKRYMDDLPSLRGSAILLDDNSERIYPIRIKPRFTWHGGEAPTAIKAEKKI
jgi:intein/homing endonuclease